MGEYDSDAVSFVIRANSGIGLWYGVALIRFRLARCSSNVVVGVDDDDVDGA